MQQTSNSVSICKTLDKHSSQENLTVEKEALGKSDYAKKQGGIGTSTT